jgi:hypothetical protein
MDWALAQQGNRRLAEDPMFMMLSDSDSVKSDSDAQQGSTSGGPKPNAGKWATLDFPDPNGKVLKDQVVAIAIGHGLFDGECQQCYIVQMPAESSKNPENRYVALMQVDVRSWSFEFTGNAQCYLDQSICYGGGCVIPNAIKVDCDDIVNNSIPQKLSQEGVQRFPGDSSDVETCAAAGKTPTGKTCAANLLV